MATKQLKFADIKVGGIFIIDGEKFKKTGPSTYVSIENPILGEYTIQPFTEARLKEYVAPVKAAVKPAKKAVKKPVAAKKPAKKTAKKK
jgi:hypothetical protein